MARKKTGTVYEGDVESVPSMQIRLVATPKQSALEGLAYQVEQIDEVMVTLSTLKHQLLLLAALSSEHWPDDGDLPF